MLIGEAAGYIPDEVTARFASVPWRKMRDLRNVVVHAYWQIDLGRVWDTIRQDLLPLVPLLEGVLAAEGPDDT